jgi:hypothetical protein
MQLRLEGLLKLGKIMSSSERGRSLVTLQVLTAASMEIAVFWDVAPCSLVEIYLRFRDAYCLNHQISFYETTQRSIPEDSHLHTRRREHLKLHKSSLSLLSSQDLHYWALS